MAWKKVKTGSGKDTVSFTNQEAEPEHDNVTIRYNEGNKEWEVVSGQIGSPEYKEFKTKSQAMSFARKYMRSH